MADLKSFSGDSDDDFRSEKEKNQISKKRKKNPLSTQAPNPKIPTKASSPSSGGGGGGLMIQHIY